MKKLQILFFTTTLLISNPILKITKDTVIFSIDNKIYNKAPKYSLTLNCIKEITYIQGKGIIQIRYNNKEIKQLKNKYDRFKAKPELCEDFKAKIYKIYKLAKDKFYFTNEETIDASGKGTDNKIAHINIKITDKKERRVFLYAIRSHWGNKPKLQLFNKKDKHPKIILSKLLEYKNHRYNIFMINIKVLAKYDNFNIVSENRIKAQGVILK